MKVLIAEDDPTLAGLLEAMLARERYQLTMVRNGLEAVDHLAVQSFDVVMTDLMMPKMDGLQLTKHIRSKFRPGPVILVVTALDEARDQLLEAGADDYIVKPFMPKDVISRLKRSIERQKQPLPTSATGVMRPSSRSVPRRDVAGVCIASSTGGPVALRSIIPLLPRKQRAIYFVVQHGPAWMLESLATQLSKASKVKVVLAKTGVRARPGVVYIAPGDHHLVVDETSLVLRLTKDDPVNHVRPSADPLFESVSRAFHDQAIAVVLTGLGCDGCAGAHAVELNGGTVLIQDPVTCVASSMPESVVRTSVRHRRLALGDLATAIGAAVDKAVSSK